MSTSQRGDACDAPGIGLRSAALTFEGLLTGNHNIFWSRCSNAYFGGSGPSDAVLVRQLNAVGLHMRIDGLQRCVQWPEEEATHLVRRVLTAFRNNANFYFAGHVVVSWSRAEALAADAPSLLALLRQYHIPCVDVVDGQHRFVLLQEIPAACLRFAAESGFVRMVNGVAVRYQREAAATAAAKARWLEIRAMANSIVQQTTPAAAREACAAGGAAVFPHGMRMTPGTFGVEMADEVAWRQVMEPCVGKVRDAPRMRRQARPCGADPRARRAAAGERHAEL